MEIWLVRHGETIWNSERRFQGARDVELSARGREQAQSLARALAASQDHRAPPPGVTPVEQRIREASEGAPLVDQWAPSDDLARALPGQHFAAAYTSPLRRARETAATCAAALGLTACPVEDLREVGLGDWEGLTVETVVERYGDHYWRWLTQPADDPPPGGEPLASFQHRVAAAVEGLRARHPEGAVLAVTHGGVIAAFLCRCLGLGLNGIWRLRIENTSVTRVSLPAGHLRVLNDTRHLP